MAILNLTQHIATNDQILDGVIEPNDKALVKGLITFETIPTAQEMRERVKQLIAIAKEHGVTEVMVGGAGYFIPFLERGLIQAGLIPLHSFNVRNSVDKHHADGSVETVMIFKHAGFVKATDHIYDDCHYDIE